MHKVRDILPGLALSALVAAVAFGAQRIEAALLGRAWIDWLVLAILFGVALRTAWTPGPVFKPGISFTAKMVLEVAVVLLGASLSAATIAAVGPWLLIGIAILVTVAVAGSYAIGRLYGLSPRMAMLIAAGNAICGNSAIAAIAPLIGARATEIAAAIAFTAVLGVAVVLLLPVIGMAAGMAAVDYGAFAGLTVYAVPQVIAAAAPFGAVAIQSGTLVKLVRVLMLGPLCLVLSLIAPRFRDAAEGVAGPAKRPRFGQLVPWFILGFLGMLALRSLGLIPEMLLGPIATAASVMTVLSMAALGLGVDLREIAKAGPRVVATVLTSLVLLSVAAFALVKLV